MIRGYMLFTADTPLIGLDPHPAYAPEPATEAFGANVWARLYNVDPDRSKLEREALEDLEAARRAVGEGDLEDWSDEPDLVFQVSVSDQGDLRVMDPDRPDLMAQYTPEQVYGAFGMTPPEPLPDQRDVAWSLIREQLDGLAGLMLAADLDRAETEFLHEDGIAGLQDIYLFGHDGEPVDLTMSHVSNEFPLPPLVSRTEFGRVSLIPLDGVGPLRDVADAVFGSLCEFVLDDPEAVIDRIRIRLSSDGELRVETDSFVNRTWAPPGPDGPDPEDDTPGL